MSVNKAILIGNLGSDPEVRFTQSGQAVANFNIATNEVYKDQGGNRQERTEWHKIVVWGRQAEICKQYLSKGRQVYIEGRIQTRQWTDRENQTRYTTEINAATVRFLNGGNAPMEGGSSQGGGFGGPPPAQGGGGDFGAPQGGDSQDGGGFGAPQQGGKPQGGGGFGESQAPAAQQPAPGGGGFRDDDIPF